MIARGGRGFVGASVIAALAAAPFQIYVSVAFVCLAAFLAFVFRNPRRKIGDGVVAPADGRVREVDPERGLVSTYLALRNVHVTRAPLSGVIERAAIIRGKHTPAFSTGSPRNERLEITLKTDAGTVTMVQMVGAIARRIVPYVKEGQKVSKGEEISLIRFGSRVDLCLPPDSLKVKVAVGQKMVAGETCIGEVVRGRME